MTMGTKPGERMMRQLERRAEVISGEFNPQNVANTLWAFATMGTKPGEWMMGQLERRAEAPDTCSFCAFPRALGVAWALGNARKEQVSGGMLVHERVQRGLEG